jgi:arsenite methyltransferase
MNPPAESTEIKTCCAAAYESDFARLLLGGSFHPGGLTLTARLGELLQLKPGMRVLDVASGRGETAVFLARSFGCEVVGLDYSATNVRLAQAASSTPLVHFAEGDAERLRFADASFDAVICECAFCTFPDKPAAAGEFERVLRRGGRVGLSDLTRSGPLPDDLEGLFAWIACIGDARPVEEYTGYLTGAGFTVDSIEPHHEALSQMARDIHTRLMSIELATKLKKLELPGIDIDEAKRLARAASHAIREGVLGYTLIAASCS